MVKKVVKIGTRGSQLALVQAEMIQRTLVSAHPDHEFLIVPMLSGGDLNKVSPLYLIGGTDKGLWTKEMEDALLQNELDMIVHCVKDLPTLLPPGCELGAICERADPRDVLVVKAGSQYKSLKEMPAGSIIGTSSVRRVAQLRRNYPHLKFSDMRGNIDTRVKKLDNPDSNYAAIILAAAGLERTNKHDRITMYLDSDSLLYAVGQGALGIETRIGDSENLTFLQTLNEWKVEWACRAERALLRYLQGGCSVPVGVKTKLEVISEHPTQVNLTLTGSLTSIPGSEYVEHTHTTLVTSAEEAEEVGINVAKHLASNGGQIILDEVEKLRQAKGDINAFKAHQVVGEGSNLLNCPAVAASSEPHWLASHPAIPSGSSVADCPVVNQKIADRK